MEGVLVHPHSAQRRPPWTQPVRFAVRKTVRVMGTSQLAMLPACELLSSLSMLVHHKCSTDSNKIYDVVERRKASSSVCYLVENVAKDEQVGCKCERNLALCDVATQGLK